MKKLIFSIFILCFISCATVPEKPYEIDETEIGKGFNIFSKKYEIEQGKGFAKEIESKIELLNDPYVESYISKIGLSIIRTYKRQELVSDYDFQFKIVNSNEVNAFATMGGQIWVNRGLIEKADSEEEIAGVIAHEIGHVAGRHISQQISRQLLIIGIVALALSSVKDEDLKRVVQVGGGAYLFFSTLRFSRDNEREADYIAIQMLHHNGYNPIGLKNFFQKLLERKKGGLELTFLSTHPTTEERVMNIEYYISKLPAIEYKKPNHRNFLYIKRVLSTYPIRKQ
ncbi:MAG: M48 family metallopeptidase [Candidatus Aminicenantia bacterium]